MRHIVDVEGVAHRRTTPRYATGLEVVVARTVEVGHATAPRAEHVADVIIRRTEPLL